MANPDHLARLKEGAQAWKKFLDSGGDSPPDMASAYKANLAGAALHRLVLPWANLEQADLSNAGLVQANLFHAFLSDANLVGSNLADANLGDADLSRADLCGAVLCPSPARDYPASWTGSGTTQPQGRGIPSVQGEVRSLRSPGSGFAALRQRFYLLLTEDHG
jgi:hypothetical protein